MNANSTQIAPRLTPLAMNLASPPGDPVFFQGRNLSSSVLLADADANHLDLVAKLIEEAGFAVVVAHDGREARKLLKSNSNFIAAVFEVVIPHISGPDLVRFMKRDKELKDIPVIMMTGSRGARMLYESLHAGATVLVPEPFSMSQLQHLLHMLVHSKES